jgi:hypothetical protein
MQLLMVMPGGGDIQPNVVSEGQWEAWYSLHQDSVSTEGRIKEGDFRGPSHRRG